MYRKMRIRFTLNPYRKIATKRNFSTKLSPYWSDMYDDMFRGW